MINTSKQNRPFGGSRPQNIFFYNSRLKMSYTNVRGPRQTLPIGPALSIHCTGVEPECIRFTFCDHDFIYSGIIALLT